MKANQQFVFKEGLITGVQFIDIPAMKVNEKTSVRLENGVVGFLVQTDDGPFLFFMEQHLFHEGECLEVGEIMNAQTECEETPVIEPEVVTHEYEYTHVRVDECE